MTIESFDDLLRAAKAQPEPQRLLFVFATAGVDNDATPEQMARFEAGQGGTLTPLMCVDKLPGELASFDALLAESREFEQAWDMARRACRPRHRCSAWSSPSSPAASAASSRSMRKACPCSSAEQRVVGVEP